MVEKKIQDFPSVIKISVYLISNSMLTPSFKLNHLFHALLQHNHTGDRNSAREQSEVDIPQFLATTLLPATPRHPK